MTIYKQIKKDIQNQVSLISTDNFDFNNWHSEYNLILEGILDNLNETIKYYNCDLLADFNLNNWGDSSLKQSSKDKLNSWLKDQDIMFLFEHDLKISRAVQYYKNENSFYSEYTHEYYSELSDGLSFKDLSQKQKDNLESMLDVYIPKDSANVFYYVGNMGFELVLPKQAILREYKEYLKDNR